MQYMQEMAKGFFWAIGSAIIFVGAYSIYTITVRANIDKEYSDELRKIYMERQYKFLNEFKPEILGFRIEGNEIIISSKTKNFNVMAGWLYLRFNIFSKGDSKLVGICHQPTVVESKESEYIYYETICTTNLVKVDEVKNITVHMAFKPKDLLN